MGPRTWNPEVAGSITGFPKVVSGSLFRQFWDVLGCVWEWFGDVFGWVWDGFEKNVGRGRKIKFSKLVGSIFPASGYTKITFLANPRPKINEKLTPNRPSGSRESNRRSPEPLSDTQPTRLFRPHKRAPLRVSYVSEIQNLYVKNTECARAGFSVAKIERARVFL